MYAYSNDVSEQSQRACDIAQGLPCPDISCVDISCVDICWQRHRSRGAAMRAGCMFHCWKHAGSIPCLDHMLESSTCSQSRALKLALWRFVLALADSALNYIFTGQHPWWCVFSAHTFAWSICTVKALPDCALNHIFTAKHGFTAVQHITYYLDGWVVKTFKVARTEQYDAFVPLWYITHYWTHFCAFQAHWAICTH